MRILIAEDDEALARFVRHGLESEHYSVDVMPDGEQARTAATEFEYDVVILDLNLPKLDGVSVLRHLRSKKPSLPVLVLTQRTRVEDRVQCLDTGADDYLAKPFSFSELSARIRALVRRSHLPSESVLVAAELRLDRVQRLVERAGRRIELTGKEFLLLEYLMLNAARSVTRSMIIEHVWNLTFDTTTNVVDVYINYLRVVFAATLVSAEHLTYREFLQRIPETTYLASCRLEPMGVNAALQLDLKVAFPIIDLLLGGEGKGMTSTREITEIEEQILDSVARIICRELGVAWQALALEVGFEDRLEPAAAQRLMPPEEKTLSLSFEVTMPDVRGGLNVAVPAVVSNALLRKISADWSQRRPRRATDSRERLMRRLLECPFQAELGAKDVRVAVSALAGLAPGDVLAFTRSAAEPASLLIAGQEMFRALPARCGNIRAARVLAAVTERTDGEPESKEKSK
jgi:flagellar motor switch protein FliM